jgi:hypothetical protein
MGATPAVDKPARKKARPLREPALSIRASAGWKEWLVRYADHNRTDMVDLIDQALFRMAREQGFDPPPKR